MSGTFAKYFEHAEAHRQILIVAGGEIDQLQGAGNCCVDLMAGGAIRWRRACASQPPLRLRSRKGIRYQSEERINNF